MIDHTRIAYRVPRNKRLLFASCCLLMLGMLFACDLWQKKQIERTLESQKKEFLRLFGPNVGEVVWRRIIREAPRLRAGPEFNMNIHYASRKNVALGLGNDPILVPSLTVDASQVRSKIGYAVRYAPKTWGSPAKIEVFPLLPEVVRLTYRRDATVLQIIERPRTSGPPVDFTLLVPGVRTLKTLDLNVRVERDLPGSRGVSLIHWTENDKGGLYFELWIPTIHEEEGLVLAANLINHES